jgi:hypothetical protein
MSTKSVVNAHYNYTGRKTIRQKSEYFSIKVTDRKENNATIHVSYNFNEIIKSVNISNDVPCELALDAYVKNNVTRATLDKQDIKHIFKINNCPEYEKIFFRIKLIANSPEEKGILLAANKSRITISDESRENEGENKENTFFKLIPDAEMKGQTWRVSWDETDNPKIFVNKRLYEAYSENRNVLQAFLLPEIIREILTGLFFRQKDLEGLPNDVGAYKWVTFFRQTLDENLNELSKLNDEEKFEKIDQITQTFSDYNWGNNKTLLDEILEGKL